MSKVNKISAKRRWQPVVAYDTVEKEEIFFNSLTACARVLKFPRSTAYMELVIYERKHITRDKWVIRLDKGRECQ